MECDERKNSEHRYDNAKCEQRRNDESLCVRDLDVAHHEERKSDYGEVREHVRDADGENERILSDAS